MKILFWTNSFWPMAGGLQTLVLTLMRSLKTRGHQCTVITEHERSTLPQYSEFESFQIYRYPFNKAFCYEKNIKLMGQILIEVRKLVSHFKPDIMHSHIGFGAHVSVFNMISKITFLPSLTSIHGLYMHDNVLLPNIYKEAFTISDWLTCVSNTVLKQARQHVPEIEHRSSCLSNALPIPVIQPLVPSFESIQILCVGRLTEEKGFDIAICAFHQLTKRIPNAKLIIAGEGCEQHYLEKLTRSLGQESNIKFLGRIEHKQSLALINTASIVIIPSRYEAFGLTALEAMQLAKPIVASRVGGLSEILRHQETGLLVPTNNIDALTEAMEELIRNPKKAIEMGQKARRDALGRFSVENMTDC